MSNGTRLSRRDYLSGVASADAGGFQPGDPAGQFISGLSRLSATTGLRLELSAIKPARMEA